MGDKLYQSELRITWAQKKIVELESLIDRAIKSALQASSSQAEAERSLVVNDFLGEVRDETRRLVSEFLFHTRSALDYVVFVLAKLTTGVEQDGTQFPINPCKKVFERDRTRKNGDWLRHLTCEQVALIESVQPYNRFPLLELFNKLSNIDKHKKLLEAGVTGTFRQVPYADADVHTFSSNQVRVNFEHTFSVYLVDWRDAGGQTATEILQELHSNIAEIVELFDTSLGSQF